MSLTRLALGLVALSLIGCGPSAAEVREPDPAFEGILAPRPSNGRLPSDVTPLGYRLDLALTPGAEQFGGRAEIRVRLAEARDVIWLHGKNLDVSRARVVLPDGTPVGARWETSGGGQFAFLELERPVGPTEATLELEWRGQVRSDHEGLFGVEAGGQRYLFTQLEPLMARHVFPSFDEPVFKTPFDVSLTVPAEHVAVANTRAVDTEPRSDGTKTVRFATSEPMPTYLVAFAVGPLDVVEADPLPPNDVRDRPVPLRGVTVRGRGEDVAWALEQTPALLDLVEGYFGTAYPYDKLDVIAIPGFGGAMENAGAITFSEALLLVEPGRSSARELRWFAYVMAHELAHHWFGNLVTMEWWDDLWLNEAFASWMEVKIVGQWNPAWHAERDRVEWTLEAMDADRLASARYVRQPIQSEHDIHNAFDFITYVKGAAVLAMFERWLGEETFRRGVHRYLQEHRWGSATAVDLVEALTAEAERPVTAPMRTFLTQSGIPMIEATPRCEGDRAAVVLEQSRYLPVGSRAESERTWQVPVCVAWGAGGERERTCVLLADERMEVALGSRGCPDWVMPNAQASGYYRWTLPPGDLEALRTTGFEHLEVTERMALADNLEAAFDSARTPGADVLEAMEPLARDPEHHVASQPMQLLSFVEEYVVTDAERPRLHEWIAGLYAPRLRELRWEASDGEPQGAGLERAALVEHLALVAEDPAVRGQAARRARRYLGMGSQAVELRPQAVEPGLRPTVLIAAAQQGDTELFEQIERHLRDLEDTQTRRNLVVALGSFRDPELASRARTLALEGDIRSFERIRILDAQLDDRVLRDDAWRWLRQNVDSLAEALAERTQLLALTRAAGWLCTREQAEQARALLTERVEPLPGGPRRLAGALESIELCIARVDAQAESVRAMFTP